MKSAPPLIPRLPDTAFEYRNGAEANRVFLWVNVSKPPFMQPVKGWAIVGYGRAPWPGSTEGFAVMFEKVTPAEPHSTFGERYHEYEEGSRIWQHGREDWVPGMPGYEGRMMRSRIRE